MKKIAIIPLIIFFSLSCTSIIAQKSDSTRKFKEKIKKGWNFGVVPAIAFDSDIGFKYGLAINFYHYGDGTIYPKYLHSLYLEWSRTTKGSGINQFIYDSKHLIPGIRLTTEASYFTERALDFYGFNGYEAFYDSRYEDDSPNNSLYRSRQYYRQERKLFRLRADFQGRFFNDRIRWLAGITNYNIKADTIDINRLNKGKSDDEKLPPVEGGLYGAYAYQYGIIPENQIHGGNTTLLKAGLVYDTRDNEPNPMHGLWSEIILIWAPKFIGNGEYSFSKVALTHRQYFTIIHKRLSFVYRLGYQAKLSGKIPWYMLPFIYNGGNSPDRDGLGGAKTMRGILRNRIVGEDYLYGNLEFRWKFLQTFLFKQNLYLALNTFTDFGMITDKYKVDTSGVDNEVFLREMFPDEKEKLHISYGAGLHTALNQNFIIAINYGFVTDKRDGDTGFYINFNWLF
jgi:outer membrane protein assembly factor BamA